MTEKEARTSIRESFGVPRETAVAAFVDLLLAEATRQNLVAASTLPSLWQRHVVDSAQLLPLADDRPGRWLDIGTGAGFPGMIVALLSDRKVTLVEPRRMRAEFLSRSVARLEVGDRVEVVAVKVAAVCRSAAVISARAVAPLADLLDQAAACATPATRWLLPKGRGALAEVELARRAWHGSFRLQPSITDEESRIVIADQVARR